VDANTYLIAIVSVTLLFGGGTLFLLAVSPIGKALAARILGRRTLGPEGGDMKEELGQLRAELEELREVRTEISELAERLDFAERLLAQQREPNRIGPA
jgi:hypothetical protein